MPDAHVNPVEVVKRAALDAVHASKPVEIRFGTVVSAEPLKIEVDQKIILTEKQLILTRNVTDFELDMTVSQQTESVIHGHSVTDTYTGGTAEPVEHAHPITGRKKFLVHNALLVGDMVLLLRRQGGKQYIVLDRIKPIPDLKGEWL